MIERLKIIYNTFITSDFVLMMCHRLSDTDG
jgi:hypothetical protein